MIEINELTLLREKIVTVIGCGGLGCNVAVHLAGVGIGKIILCDFDTVNKTNLNRQFLYTGKDIGKKKSAVAKKRLVEYNPEIRITEVDRKITKYEDLDFAKNCDLIILAVDNNETRRIVSDFCTAKKITLVNGGINEFYGTAYLYVPDKTPCLSCAGLLSENTKKIVSVSSTVGIIGSLEAELSIKYLLNSDTGVAGKLFIHDNCETHSLNIKKNRDCLICNPETR